MELESMLAKAMEYINPLGFSLWMFIGVAIAKAVSAEMLNLMILQGLHLVSFPKMPSREPVPISKGLEYLERKDYVFLVLNQAVELVFLLNLAVFALTLPREAEELTVLNTVVVFYAAFLLDDFFYYFMHRFLHVPAVYPYVHKHHHRQPLPYRGYVDAANESPLEQVGGLACIFGTIKILTPLLGFHVFTLATFFSVFAVLAYLNHTPYDIKLGIWGLEYTVRAHETHHRMLRGNYSQNTMLWDKLFGTYLEYPSRKFD